MIRFRSECSTTTWATCPSQSPVNALYLAVVHPKKYLHARTLNERGLSKWDRGSRFHVNSAIVRAERPSSYNPGYPPTKGTRPIMPRSDYAAFAPRASRFGAASQPALGKLTRREVIEIGYSTMLGTGLAALGAAGARAAETSAV